MHDLNESPGRNSSYEPKPVSIDMLFCKWQNKRLSKDEAKTYFNSVNLDCLSCLACQELTTKPGKL